MRQHQIMTQDIHLQTPHGVCPYAASTNYAKTYLQPAIIWCLPLCGFTKLCQKALSFKHQLVSVLMRLHQIMVHASSHSANIMTQATLIQASNGVSPYAASPNYATSNPQSHGTPKTTGVCPYAASPQSVYTLTLSQVYVLMRLHQKSASKSFRHHMVSALMRLHQLCHKIFIFRHHMASALMRLHQIMPHGPPIGEQHIIGETDL